MFNLKCDIKVFCSRVFFTLPSSFESNFYATGSNELIFSFPFPCSGDVDDEEDDEEDDVVPEDYAEDDDDDGEGAEEEDEEDEDA